MKLTSRVFQFGDRIPTKYTCDGERVNPPLEISGVPVNAVSLVLIMDDPDVPTSVRADRMWVHWIIIDMPPSLSLIPENHQPPGIRGKNTGNTLVYQGPCPPDREHRYFFKLYALDCHLHLQEGCSKAQVEKAMVGHIVAEAKLMGKYERKSH